MLNPTPSDLPRALAPWARYLTLFPRELALALGPLVQRLDLAIGPMHSVYRSGLGDPEGFAGLARRGPYERLLLSEWLLAEEAPDEFARRAAMGEHGFLEIARRQAAGARACVVFFDGGPDQLGAPRIAHLAALVVLARRAEVGGSRFHWGQLQDRERGLGAGIDPAAINWILHARSARRPVPEDFREWQKELDAREPAEDLWLIGGRRSAGFGRDTRASLLEIEDPYEPEASRLEVTVRQPQYGTRRIVLDLPPEDVCIRLLRDPFQAAVAPVQKAPARYGAASSLVWGPGLKLFARANAETLISYSLPNSPRAQAGKPKLLRPRSGRPILAAGRFRKTTFAITAAPVDSPSGSIQLEPLSGRSSYLPADRYQSGVCDLPRNAFARPLGNCVVLQPRGLAQSGQPVVVEVFVDGTLMELRAPPVGQSLNHTPLVVGGVLGLTPVEQGMTAVLGREGAYLLQHWSHDGAASPREVPAPDLKGAGQVFFGYGGGLADPEWGLAALQVSDHEWTVLDRGGAHTLVPPRESEVVGVVHPGGSWNSSALVVLEPGRRSLWVLGREKHHVLPPPSAEIAHVAVSPHDALVAYTTVPGDVVVYSLYENTVLYRLSGEAGS